LSLYENPRNLFQARVNSILRAEPESDQVFETIFKLNQVLQNERLSSESNSNQWKTMLQLLELLGSKTFVRVIEILKGQTLKFPSSEELEDSILTTICYYYKEIQGKNWDDIRAEINVPNLNTISYGIKVRNLKAFIDNSTLVKMNKMQEQSK